MIRQSVRIRPFRQDAWCTTQPSETSVPGSTQAVEKQGGGRNASAGEDECCFRLTVSDEHNTEVSDTSEAFCVAKSAGEGSGEGGGGRERGQEGRETRTSGGRLEVLMSPKGSWTKGTTQEVTARAFPPDQGRRVLGALGKHRDAICLRRSSAVCSCRPSLSLSLA